MKNKPILQMLMIGVGIIILFTAVLIGNQTHSQTPKPRPLFSEEESFPEVMRVALEEAFLANNTGSAVFINVRDRSAYEETHIPGSLSFTLAKLESQLKELDPNSWIITTVPDRQKNQTPVRREFSWIMASRRLPLFLVVFEPGRTPVTRWKQVLSIA